MAELDEIFMELSGSGEKIDLLTYKGTMTRLPDGTKIGYRTKASTSPDATIDITTEKMEKLKIHANREKWCS